MSFRPFLSCQLVEFVTQAIKKLESNGAHSFQAMVGD